MQQRFTGVPQPQPDTEEMIIWPEPNDLSDWWHRIMADGERPAGKTEGGRSRTR